LFSAKIYFDGALPSSKRPTRISRLEESLRQLCTVHALYAHTLPQCTDPRGEVADVFSEKAVYTSRPCLLPSPPFLMAATFAALSSSEYAGRTSTVPGEAEGYAARDAIAAGGIVLTSDSDLLLFRGDGEASTWGVVMFRDVEVDFAAGKISTLLFRPDDIAKGFDLELAFLGYLSHCDPRASFSTIRERCAAIAERGKGVEGEMGRKWREFAAGYTFPEGDGGRLVDPRIAEVLSLRGCVGRKKEMFMPMLWEDTSRASAWDVGREVRALAYSLLFPAEMSLEEISRRGHGIAGTPVGIMSGREVKRRLHDVISESQEENWLARHTLRQIVGVFATRKQPPPHTSILESCACLMSGGNRPDITTTTSRKKSADVRWTWERIQIFAMLQAAWFSLVLLSEVLKETADDKTRLDVLPVGTLDRRRFTDALPGVGDRALVREVLAGYFEEEVEEEEEERREGGIETGNGISKEEACEGVWKAVGGRARKEKRRGPPEKAEVGGTVIGGGNMFAALVG